MRIALVAPFGLVAKGTSRARALPLGRALAARGHQVALFVPPYDSPPESGGRWVDAGVEVVNVMLPAGPQNPLFHIRLGWRLWRAVTAWGPEVTHVFKPKGPSGLVGCLQNTLRRHTPLVIDSDDWEGPGGWNDDPRTGYSPAQRLFFAWQERYGLSHASAWTVASDCLRTRALSLGARDGRVFLLHNGLAAPDLLGLASDLGPAQSLPRVALYTRFAGADPEGVAQVWRRVREQIPAATLVVIGRGLANEEQQLARLAAGVEVVGWRDPAYLRETLRTCRLALVPWRDSPSNRSRHSAKVLEVMAAGLPVCGYDVGEMAATIGEGGRLVPPGEPQRLADVVCHLLNDPLLAASLGRTSAERIRSHFTWDSLVEVALAAYRCR